MAAPTHGLVAAHMGCPPPPREGGLGTEEETRPLVGCAAAVKNSQVCVGAVSEAKRWGGEAIEHLAAMWLVVPGHTHVWRQGAAGHHVGSGEGV